MDSASPFATHTLALQAVDVTFPLQGTVIPFEHSYALYGALSALLPALHEADWLGIHPIHGMRTESQLRIGHGTCLRLRLPPDKIRDVQPLVGRTLQIGADRIAVGAPSTHMLRPHGTLHSYRVTIKNAMDDAQILRGLLAELAALQIQATLSVRRVRALQIKDARIVCYRVIASDLSGESSLRLQIHGLGGRRRMGCGLFDVMKEPQ